MPPCSQDYLPSLYGDRSHSGLLARVGQDLPRLSRKGRAMSAERPPFDDPTQPVPFWDDDTVDALIDGLYRARKRVGFGGWVQSRNEDFSQVSDSVRGSTIAVLWGVGSWEATDFIVRAYNLLPAIFDRLGVDDPDEAGR